MYLGEETLLAVSDSLCSIVICLSLLIRTDEVDEASLELEALRLAEAESSELLLVLPL